MAFDQRFLEELRQRIPIHTVIGRKVKLTRSGRFWKACCPFHGEKTPSFYIYEDHFHCYGCGVHGDVISFVMQSEGRTFGEAIKELAALAGLDIPEQTYQDRQRIEKQHSLYDVMLAAQDYYRLALDTPLAKTGKQYLLERGILNETFETFKLGWSGDGRGGLIHFLKEKGYDLELIGEAGLLRKKSDTEWGGELFFNRVIYPIHDRKGRPIAFGGRIIGDGQPKYLNSPETPLFSKRRTLFGLNHLSSLFVRKEVDPLYNTVLVVEGYMDVIALYQAGFHGAVAPLGTALTKDQMGLLWRVTPEPVLCFDGDRAGHKAMLHAAEESLPILTSEHTLNFLTLPEGEDPDSFVKNQGGEAFLKLIPKKQSLCDAIYGIVSAHVDIKSPEQRAALKTRLISIAQHIDDKILSKEYRRILLDRFYQQFYPKADRYGTFAKKTDVNLSNRIQKIDKEQIDYKRICILFAILLHYPELLFSVESAFCQLDLPAKFIKLREFFVGISFEGTTLDDRINFLEKEGFSDLINAINDEFSISSSDQLSQKFDLHLIEKQWWHFYGLLNIQELENQVELARKAWVESPDEQHQNIFVARVKALEIARTGSNNEREDDFL